MDKAGRSTDTPLMVTPLNRDADPDGESLDAVSDNETMSSSRTSSGNSRSSATGSGTSPAYGGTRSGANGKAAASGKGETVTGSGDAESAEATEGTRTAGKASVPLPADGIGKSTGTGPAAATSASAGEAAADDTVDDARKGSASPAPTVSTPADSGRQSPRTTTMAAGSGSKWLSGQSAKPDSLAAAEDDDWKPSFTPSLSESSYSSSAYSGSPYSSAPAKSADWGTSPDSAHGSPSGGSGTSYSSASSGHAPSYSPPSASPDADSSARSGGGASAGAAAAGGAAAGLAGYASSVTSAWQNRNRKQGAAARRPAKGKRQAMLTLARLEPWSVMKFSFIASVVAFVILFVAVAMLYMVLAALGVFDSLQHTVSTITSSQNNAGTNISHWFSASLILGYTAMLGALNIVLITAMSTVGAVIYNLIAKTVGGIEVTLRETE